jgi:hypothetical protein
MAKHINLSGFKKTKEERPGLHAKNKNIQV